MVNVQMINGKWQNECENGCGCACKMCNTFICGANGIAIAFIITSD